MTGANERRGVSEVAPPEAAQAGHQAPASPAAPSRPEWLEARREGIGSTDAAVLMGTAPHGDAWSVWLSKVHGVDDPGGEDAEIGRWLERPIAEWALDQLGGDRKLLAGAHHVGAEPWMMCTPDFWLIDAQEMCRDDLWVGLEVKATDRWSEDQVQWQMLVTGRPVWLLAEYVPMRWSRRIHTINADPERQALMRSTCWAWWQRHVVEGVPPEVDGSDACRDWLVGQSPTARDEIRAATGDEELLARDVYAAEQATKSLEAEAARARNRLRASMGDVRRVYFTGGAATWSRKSNRLTVRIDP